MAATWARHECPPLYGRQWFGDPDRVQFEPDAAVVMRVKGEPGTVGLLEASVAGDTVWHRHLRLEPRRLTARMVEEVVDRAVEELAPNARTRCGCTMWCRGTISASHHAVSCYPSR